MISCVVHLNIYHYYIKIVHTAPSCLCVLLQSGQVYFINDGVSVNVFEWLTPLVSRAEALVSDVFSLL